MVSWWFTPNMNRNRSYLLLTDSQLWLHTYRRRYVQIWRWYQSSPLFLGIKLNNDIFLKCQTFNFKTNCNALLTWKVRGHWGFSYVDKTNVSLNHWQVQDLMVRGQKNWPAPTSKASSPRWHPPLHLWEGWRDDGGRRGRRKTERRAEG